MLSEAYRRNYYVSCLYYSPLRLRASKVRVIIMVAVMIRGAKYDSGQVSSCGGEITSTVTRLFTSTVPESVRLTEWGAITETLVAELG